MRRARPYTDAIRRASAEQLVRQKNVGHAKNCYPVILLSCYPVILLSTAFSGGGSRL